MARKRRKRTRSEVDEGDVRAEPRRRVGRFKRRLAVLVLLVVGLLAAAPAIVSRSGLRNTLATGQLPTGWQVRTEQASLGWFTPQQVAGLTLTDPEGQPLLQAESLTISQPLLSLLLSRNNLGKIEILRPTVYVDLRPEGSNWESLLAALKQAHPEVNGQGGDVATTATKQTGEIVVVDGLVRGIDRASGQQWQLEAVQGNVTLGENLQASGSGELLTDQSPARGKIQLQWQPAEAGSQQLHLIAERLPLGPLRPALARAIPGAELKGTVSADSQIIWRPGMGTAVNLQTSGRLEANQLEASAVVLRGDRLTCQRLVVPWSLSFVEGSLAIDQLDASTEWAEFSAEGSIPLKQLQNWSLENLPSDVLQVTGKADLAKVANMLPNMLNLREGVRIDAGQLELTASVQPQGEQTLWQAKAVLANVAGSDGQRQIRWQAPIEAALTARDSAAGPRLEAITLTSPFAEATLQTRQEAIEGEFQVDLDRLSEELGQLVDLSQLQLSGLGEGTFTVQRGGDSSFRTTANADLTNLNIAQQGRALWTEPKLNVTAEATGSHQDYSLQQLSTAKLQLTGPRDQWQAELAGPVDLQAEGQLWPLKVEGNGALALWAGRLRPWVEVPGVLEGDAHLQADVQLGSERVEVARVEGSVVQLRLQGEGLAVDEPRVEFSGEGLWDRASRSLVARQVLVMGSTVSFQAQDVNVALGQSPTARGNMAFRTDLERLAAAAGRAGQTAWPRGTAVGRVQLSGSGEALTADFGMKLEPLQLMRTVAAGGALYGRPEVVWQEPALELKGLAKYSVSADRVQLDNLEVTGQTLRLSSSASIDRLNGDAQLQASGLVQYDANQLANLVASYTQQGVQVQGDQQIRFQVSGPLSDPNAAGLHWAHRWQGSAEAGWTSAGAYGLPLGGGKLSGTLREGQLQFAPLDVAVGQGRFTASPLIRLLPGSEQLVLTQGPLLAGVAISPEVSETMLKYVAPILAGATRTEGQFSIDLDAAEVPLDHPKTGRVQGRMVVQRLAVSPGPMLMQVAALVEKIEALTKGRDLLQAVAAPQAKTFLTMADREIDFQIVEGRVYHRNLEFLIDDVPVRSYGSVGFDQTLALMIEVPFQDRWIEREPALRGFAGQTIKLPVQGTFQKPRIDERAVADLTRQLLQGAASQAIGNELNRQLEKLFGR